MKPAEKDGRGGGNRGAGRHKKNVDEKKITISLCMPPDIVARLRQEKNMSVAAETALRIHFKILD